MKEHICATCEKKRIFNKIDRYCRLNCALGEDAFIACQVAGTNDYWVEENVNET